MKPVFSPLRLQDLGDRRFELLAPLVYLPAKIEVPRGFVTDYASVPRLFWSIVPPFGRYGVAAVLHDYLYSVEGRLPGGRELSRFDADTLFLDAMEALGVRWSRRRVMFRAVRTFGWLAWGRRDEGDVPPAGMTALRVGVAAVAFALSGCVTLEACKEFEGGEQVCAGTDFRTVKVRAAL